MAPEESQQQSLVYAELKAFKVVEEVLASARKACDFGFLNSMSTPSSLENMEKSTGENALLDMYYYPASLQMAAFFRARLYEALFEQFKQTAEGTELSSSLDEFALNLEEDLRELAKAKAREFVVSFASTMELQTEATNRMDAVLEKVKELAHGYIQRRSTAIREPTLEHTERQQQIERLERDTRRYVNRQLRSRLEDDRPAAIQHIFRAATTLHEQKRVRCEYYAGEFQKWADDALRNYPL